MEAIWRCFLPVWQSSDDTDFFLSFSCEPALKFFTSFHLP